MSNSEKKRGNRAEDPSRRDFLRSAGIATLALGSGVPSLTPAAAEADSAPSRKAKPGGATKPDRYNVLFIMSDQERYLPELLGKGHWPGRDRLAEMGTTFENHQVCSMVCTSSRSVIYTGQHIQHNRMFDNTNFPWIQDLSFELATIGHMMRDAGYYSTYQGKWHLNARFHEHFPPGEPIQLLGFEAMDKYGFSDFTGIGDAVGDTLGGYVTDQFVTATAQAWLRRQGKPLNEDGKPWFLALNLVNPHDVMFYNTDIPGQVVQGDPKPMMPIAREPRDAIYQKRWDVPLPPNRQQAWDEAGRPRAHYEYQTAASLLTGAIPNEDERWRRMQNYYFNCISDCDRSVDTILTELDNLGMMDHTIIIFTADHGELCGAHGMWGKGATAYREQNNVPFILYHPDVPGGRKCRAVTSHVDLIPTILAMTGADKKQKAEVAENLRGHDVSPVLQNPEEASFDAVREGALYCFSMWSYMDADWLQQIVDAVASGKKLTKETAPKPDAKNRSAIRTVYDGRYKYSRYFSPLEHNRPMDLEQIFRLNDVELFDLENDPHERKNLASEQERQELLLAMNEKLNRLIESEVGKDDGSHLPDLEGVNWAFERFDP